jgi:hypothetical protein
MSKIETEVTVKLCHLHGKTCAAYERMIQRCRTDTDVLGWRAERWASSFTGGIAYESLGKWRYHAAYCGGSSRQTFEGPSGYAALKQCDLT